MTGKLTGTQNICWTGSAFHRNHLATRLLTDFGFGDFFGNSSPENVWSRHCSPVHRPVDVSGVRTPLEQEMFDDPSLYRHQQRLGEQMGRPETEADPALWWLKREAPLQPLLSWWR